MTYTSIFKNNPSREKLLTFIGLNLDTKQDMNFSHEDIKKAYRIKAKEIHPDKQKNKENPLSETECISRMQDLNRAYDILTQKEDGLDENIQFNTLLVFLTILERIKLSEFEHQKLQRHPGRRRAGVL
jgi:hypothetical protein